MTFDSRENSQVAGFCEGLRREEPSTLEVTATTAETSSEAGNNLSVARMEPIPTRALFFEAIYSSFSNELFNARREIMMNRSIDPEERRSSLRNAVNSMTEELVRMLDSERSRFSCIFTTESGSQYYQTPDGASIRIKKVNADSFNPGNFEVTPPFRQLVFLSPEETARLQDMRSRREFEPYFSGEPFPGILGKEVAISACSPGVTPFEFSICHRSDIAYTIENLKLVIHGDTLGGLGIYHFGHPVAEVMENKMANEHPL